MASQAVVKRPTRRPVKVHGLVTGASSMTDLFELVGRVARTDASVLVRGETGTGKEHVARMVHDLSPRSGHPFRAVNCATLTPELLASELFGHVRGAFTGAVRDRKGLFQAANRGTVFLDEVAELPLELQARLLRVLQERSFVPVGATEPVTVDVRIVSATHEALRGLVGERRFRQDLMYRLRVVPLFLPPLRERTGDIELLLWHFIDEFNRLGLRQIEGVAKDALDALLGYNWPGNVRELRNVVEYAFAVGEGPTIRVSEFPPELRGEPPRARGGRAQSLEELERDDIVSALRRSRGRKGDAAKILGMSRSTLWRKMREHGLQT